jgi:hypothetical protein
MVYRMVSLGLARYRLQLCVEPYLSDLLLLQDRIRHSSLCSCKTGRSRAIIRTFGNCRRIARSANVSAKTMDIHFGLPLYLYRNTYIT